MNSVSADFKLLRAADLVVTVLCSWNILPVGCMSFVWAAGIPSCG